MLNNACSTKMKKKIRYQKQRAYIIYLYISRSGLFPGNCWDFKGKSLYNVVNFWSMCVSAADVVNVVATPAIIVQYIELSADGGDRLRSLLF